MDATVTLFIINALMGLIMYFMKMAHDRTREDIKDLKVRYDTLRDTSFHKADFKEFKDDLYRRIDKMEDNVKQQLAEFKN